MAMLVVMINSVIYKNGDNKVLNGDGIEWWLTTLIGFSHSILNKPWNKYFRLLVIHYLKVNCMKFEHVDIEQNYIHTHVRIIQRNGLKNVWKIP